MTKFFEVFCKKSHISYVPISRHLSQLLIPEYEPNAKIWKCALCDSYAHWYRVCENGTSLLRRVSDFKKVSEECGNLLNCREELLKYLVFKFSAFAEVSNIYDDGCELYIVCDEIYVKMFNIVDNINHKVNNDLRRYNVCGVNILSEKSRYLEEMKSLYKRKK